MIIYANCILMHVDWADIFLLYRLSADFSYSMIRLWLWIARVFLLSTSQSRYLFSCLCGQFNYQFPGLIYHIRLLHYIVSHLPNKITCDLYLILTPSVTELPDETWLWILSAVFAQPEYIQIHASTSVRASLTPQPISCVHTSMQVNTA